MNTFTHHNHPREDTLDILRGIFVFLMVLAHAIYFITPGGGIVFDSVSRFGNTVAFVGFLFVSGASLYFAYLIPSTKTKHHKFDHFYKRLLYLLLGYYVIALLASAESLMKSTPHEAVGMILQTLLFLNLPSFSEFMIPFLFFSISVVPLSKLYRYVSKDLLLTLVSSAFIFTVAYILYPIPLDSPWREIKSLFVGETGLNRFPFLQYYSVFLLGLYWGHFLSKNPEQSAREKKTVRFGVWTLLVLLVTTIVSGLFPLAILNPINRWPPSVGFLAGGLAFVFVSLIVLSNLRKTAIAKQFMRFLDYLGRDAFDIFIIHILLLYFYNYFIDFKTSSIILFSIVFILFFTLTVFISSLNWHTSPSIFTIKSIRLTGKSKYRPKKRHLIGAGIFALVVFININFNSNASTFGDTINPLEIIGTENQPLETPLGETQSIQPQIWYNREYPEYIQIVVRNTDPIRSVEVGDWLAFSTNELSSIMTPPNKSHLEVVYYRNSEYVPVEFAVDYEADIDTLYFRAPVKLFPGRTDNRYFVYFKGSTAITPQSDNIPERLHPLYSVNWGAHMQYPLQINASKQWLFNTPLPDSGLNELVVTLSVNDSWQEYSIDPKSVRYAIDGTNVTGKLGEVSAGEYKAFAVMSDVTPGTYRLIVSADTNKGELASQSLVVNVTQPILAAWTVDWEGWDVTNQQLESLEDQTLRHGSIPLTHFFNPRIYVTPSVSAQRAQYLTEWVKQRQGAHGDEIALHLHMHKDLLIAAGIEPHDSPRWGSSNTDGYDVLTTSYDYEQISTLLQWAKDQFNRNGLGTPLGYRAGGWFADTTTLRALENSGFIYDSSAREKEMWGGAITSPWNANAETQPYYPSRSDQNHVGNLNFDPENTFRIIEIPNNGGDSYGYSANAMIERFNRNYSGKGPSGTTKAVVFLSHPQTQLTDEPVMENVLNHVNKYLYTKDNGPVVWVTLDDIVAMWEAEQQ